jgi:hypothetical protein
MDVRKFAVKETGRLELRDANDNLMLTDDGKQVAVILYSPASKQYASAQAGQQNRLVDLLRQKGKADSTASDNDKIKAEYLADCTVSFENLEYDKLTGRELLEAVYGDRSIGFIADQVNKYLGEWGNFTKG